MGGVGGCAGKGLVGRRFLALNLVEKTYSNSRLNVTRSQSSEIRNLRPCSIIFVRFSLSEHLSPVTLKNFV